jgi:hypothetical protein
VALAWRWGEVGRILVTECVQHLGVRAVPLDKFVSETSSGQRPYPGKIVLARHASVDRGKADGRDPAADFAVDRLGDRFSPAEIGKIALRIIAGRFERSMPPMLEADDEFICSEYVVRALARIGAEIEWDRLGFLAPVDVARDPRVSAVARIQTR